MERCLITSSAIEPLRGPGRLRSYVELCRASNLPTVWTNVLAAVVLSGAWAWPQALAAGLAATLIYLGGMALNDVLDVEEDKVRKPSRPIPSGRVPMAGAVAFAAALFGAGLLLLAVFCSMRALTAGAVLIGVVYLYDRLHGYSPVTVLLMASCRALVFIVAALAVAGSVNRLVAVAATAQFLYIVALSAVARWEKTTTRSFRVPPIPWLLAGISLVDGAVLALLAAPAWFAAGVLGAALTRLLQTQVRGD
jgi:4-hydroxybenzoate polyprenyltransferase